MSNRSFAIGITCLGVTAVGFTFWAMNQDEDVTKHDTSHKQVTSKKSSRKTFNLGRQRNRFQSLTDRSIRWQVRVDQLRRLDASTLNQTEVDYLYRLLKQHPQGHPNEAWWVVVNEVMEVIVKQNIAADRITPEFAAIIQDANLDPVVRDYAVQHICNYMKGKENLSAKQTDLVLGSLIEVILDSSNQHNTIPGTTLMGLVEVAANPELREVILNEVSKLDHYLTSQIMGGTQGSLANRTSAINVVGLLKLEQFQPQLRELIYSDSTNASAKLSSIAALGDYYSGKQRDYSAAAEDGFDDRAIDRELLESIATGNTKFKYAAAAALKKIQ